MKRTRYKREKEAGGKKGKQKQRERGGFGRGGTMSPLGRTGTYGCVKRTLYKREREERGKKGRQREGAKGGEGDLEEGAQ